MAHADSSRLAMAQQVFSDSLDTKSILRRQLIKRKLSAVDAPTIAGATTAYTPDVFGMQSNKMLIRSTSEMPYQTGVYHVPLQHSTSFPDGSSYHHHMLYRGFSGEESYLAQLHSPTTSTDYLFEGGYTTLAPVRPHTLTFRPSQRSPDQSNESNSPVNGHSAQRNQNNNTHVAAVHYNNQYFANPFSSVQVSASKSAPQEAAYYHAAVPTHSQATARSSPANLTPASRVARRGSSVRRSVDGLFRDVNEIIDGELVQNESTTSSASTASDNTKTTQARSTTSLYGTVQSPSKRRSPQTSPNAIKVREAPVTLPSLYISWKQSNTNDSDVSQPTNLSMHAIKEESHGSPQVDVATPTAPTVKTSEAYIPSSNAVTNSLPTNPATLDTQLSNEAQDYRIRSSDKPYHVQYSISSGHPSTMQQYQAAAAAFYAAAQQNQRPDGVEGGLELMKKYGNMSNMVSYFIFIQA